MSRQGTPCWYELTTPDLNGAQTFYSAVIGWTVADCGMPGMDYRLATADAAMVAGMRVPDDPGMPPYWTIYFTVPNCDTAANAAMADGATVFMEPFDIPGIGRFAIVADPQGAVFCILTIDGPREAYDKAAPWPRQLARIDDHRPQGGFRLLFRLFGWKAAPAWIWAPMGSYDLFSATQAPTSAA